jgi:ankyrin repeat protein
MAGGSQCRGDHVRTALLLLEAGAEVDAPGGQGAFTPMYAAVCRADLEKVRLLIAWGADVDHKITTGDRDTFLHQVARRQELPVADAVSMIKLLIDAGADVNALDCAGRTPLVVAVHADCARALRVLGGRRR